MLYTRPSLLNGKKIVLALVAAAALLLPNFAGAQVLLDTGTPTGGSTFVISSASSIAGEFAATSGVDVTQLSAYLTQGVQGSFFTFDIFSSLPTRSNRVSPIFSFVATYTAAGWNSANVNWTAPATGDYWLALTSSTPTTFDAPSETSATTGTVPALGFAFGSTTSYTVSSSSAIGLQVVAAPEPTSWVLGLVAAGVFAFLWQGRHRSMAL